MAAVSAHADGLRLSGYGTLAAVEVDAPEGRRFLRDITQRRDADDGLHLNADTRLGLQANWQPEARLELVGQAVLRRRAASAPASESLEWAFAAWRPTPEWQLRVGRTSPDLFLLADYRNVGFAYPWVRPPVEAYGWMPFYSMDGADLSRQWGEDARWTGRVFAGRGRSTIAGAEGYRDARARTPRVLGGTLSRQSGGLTLKATVASAYTTLEDTVGLAALRDTLLQVASASLPGVSAEAGEIAARIDLEGFSTRYLSLGASWEQGAWQLQGEWTRLGGSYRAHNGRFAYLSAGYRQGPLTFFGVAARAWPQVEATAAPAWGAAAAPLLGPVAAARLQALADALRNVDYAVRHEQHTGSLGLRWDLSPSLAAKLQVDRVRVASFGAGLWSSHDAAPPMSATVGTLTLDFVF